MSYWRKEIKAAYEDGYLIPFTLLHMQKNQKNPISVDANTPTYIFFLKLFFVYGVFVVD